MRRPGRTRQVFVQILGANAVHNDADPDSYEYGSPDRASQYYGELHGSGGCGPLVRCLEQ